MSLVCLYLDSTAASILPDTTFPTCLYHDSTAFYLRQNSLFVFIMRFNSWLSPNTVQGCLKFAIRLSFWFGIYKVCFRATVKNMANFRSESFHRQAGSRCATKANPFPPLRNLSIRSVLFCIYYYRVERGLMGWRRPLLKQSQATTLSPSSSHPLPLGHFVPPHLHSPFTPCESYYYITATMAVYVLHVTYR